MKYLHDQVAELPNHDAADADGNGHLDMADPMRLLEYLFAGAPSPVPQLVASESEPDGSDDESAGETCEATGAQ
jgi:hypothetical protein